MQRIMMVMRLLKVMMFDEGGDGWCDTNSGLRRSPPSVRSATMATNKTVGTSTF